MNAFQSPTRSSNGSTVTTRRYLYPFFSTPVGYQFEILPVIVVSKKHRLPDVMKSCILG